MVPFARSLALLLTLWSYTTSSLSLPLAANRITCFEGGQGRTHTSVDGCRPTLNYLRTLPGYRKPEQFQKDKHPKIPSTSPGQRFRTPPFVWHLSSSDCILQIDTVDPSVVDRFTFEQARALATDVLEDCQKTGGFGGFADLGRGIGWQ